MPACMKFSGTGAKDGLGGNYAYCAIEKGRSSSQLGGWFLITHSNGFLCLRYNVLLYMLC